MAGKGYLTFEEFKKHIVNEDGTENDTGLSKLDAIIAQKILGKKLKLSGDGVTFLRVESPGAEYKKGGSFRVKQYTRNSDALDELIDQITAGDIQICRYYNNSMAKGQPNKGAKYHVAVQWLDHEGKLCKVEQKGSSFNMKIVTVAALLRWKGMLLAPGQKSPDDPIP